MARITDKQKAACAAVIASCGHDPYEVIILALSIVTTALSRYDEKERRRQLSNIIHGFNEYMNSGKRVFAEVDFNKPTVRH